MAARASDVDAGQQARWPADAVQVAVVGRPHGVHGELRMVPSSGDPSRLLAVRAAWLTGPGGEGGPSADQPSRLAVRVQSTRVHGNAALVRLVGVEDRDAAAALTHAEVWVSRSVLPVLGPDEFAVDDVLGASLFDGEHLVGVVVGVASAGGRDVFEVRHGERIVLVPAVKEWLVSLDLPSRRIVMRLPVGLVES